MPFTLTIGQLSKLTRARAGTIRFYEQAGLLPAPDRTSSNYRKYGEADVRRVSFIRRARSFGFSLDAIRQLLNYMANPKGSCAPVMSIVTNQLAAIDEQLRELAALRTQLAELAKGCESQPMSGCDALDTLLQPPGTPCAGRG